MYAERSATCGKIRSRHRGCIQRSMLQDVYGSIVGKNGNLSAPIAVPNEIA
jgi:hypothetical protein